LAAEVDVVGTSEKLFVEWSSRVPSVLSCLLLLPLFLFVLQLVIWSLQLVLQILIVLCATYFAQVFV